MEYENKYATKGVAGTGLNSRGSCSEDHHINRYEASQSARIAELETEVKLRNSNTYTDRKISAIKISCEFFILFV